MVRGYQAQEYRRQAVMGASPLRLVLMTYDIALQACEQRDFPRAAQAVGLLRDALNFDAGEAAVGLFRLYQWCLDCLRNGEFEEAAKVLRELRQAWATVEARQAAMATVPVETGLGQARAAA